MTRSPSPSAEIRSAGAADALTLAELRWRFRAAEAPPIEDRDPFVARCASWMLGALAGDTWRAWLAVVEGGAVGCCWLQLVEKVPNPCDERERHGYVTSLFVEPDHRGGGTGARLLAAALHAGCAAGVDQLVLWRSAGSRSLYERAGFVEPAPRVMSRGGA